MDKILNKIFLKWSLIIIFTYLLYMLFSNIISNSFIVLVILLIFIFGSSYTLNKFFNL